MTLRTSVLISTVGRSRHVQHFLRSVRASAARSFEVVVVDDGSPAGDDVQQFSGEQKTMHGAAFRVRVLRLKDPAAKRHQNGVVGYNSAAAVAEGDVLLIQDSGTAHCGDLLLDLERDPPGPRAYRAYACYATTEELMAEVWRLAPTSWPPHRFYEMQRAMLGPLATREAHRMSDLAWFTHSVYRPAPYYSAAALPAKLFRDLGGFDLRFAFGRWYDDNDILERLAKAGASIAIRDEPFVIHQYHEQFPYTAGNVDLFNRVRQEPGFQRNGGALVTPEFGGIYEEVPA